LDYVGGNTRAHAKLGELGVYDGGGACDLPHDRGSCIPYSGKEIHHGVCGILWAGVWCTITSVSPLAIAVLQSRTASLDLLKDLAHGVLCNTV
jgi:hypothetical protein